MNKSVCIGTLAKSVYGKPARVFVQIRFTDGRLSITGVEGPYGNGDAAGACGQIDIGYPAGALELADGWTPEMVARLREVWGRWHLNNMRAGSPRQAEYLRAHPVSATYPDSHYEAACRALEAVGLNPDPADGYRYGSAWLREEVPADVIAWLESLPESNGLPPRWAC